MGVQRRYVPHFKGLIYGKVEPEAQGRDSTFTFRHAQLKKAILLLKRPKVPRLFLGTVCINTYFYFLDIEVSDSGLTCLTPCGEDEKYVENKVDRYKNK